MSNDSRLDFINTERKQDEPNNFRARNPEEKHFPKIQGAPTFGRYTEIPIDQLTKEQQEGYRAFQLVEGDGSPTLPGPLKIWLNNPALTLAIALATHFRPTHHLLTSREREIIVCMVAGKWHSAFATNTHAEILEGLGVSTKQVEALITHQPTSFTDPGEQLVYDIAVTS